MTRSASGGALQPHPVLTALDPTLAFRDFQRLKRKRDEPLANLAFKCNLRHYRAVQQDRRAAGGVVRHGVGECACAHTTE